MQKKIMLAIFCLIANTYSYAETKVLASAFKAATSQPIPTSNQAKQPIIPVNKIIAFVNKSVITEHQVDMLVAQAVQNFKQKGIILPSMSDIRSRVIEQLVMQQIQLDLAAKAGIKTNDLEVAEAINNIARAQHMDVPSFKANLAKQGVSFDEFRRQIQNQIILDKLKQREVDGRVVVNEDEINRILNSQAYKNKIDYNLSDIIIETPEQGTAELFQQKLELANKAYSELEAGVPFNQVAVKYSNAPNALNGGELGWKSSATLPPVIATALKDLNPGNFTTVIRLPVGFFIFKINDIKKHGTPQIVHQYHVRHILIKVNEATSDEEAHQKIIEIKHKLDQVANNPAQLNADFIKYAKQYSEDTSSINGGDIGWISKGDTVPVFEQAVLNSPINVISAPLRSPFGWHIVQVLGTRDSNLTNDREKADIRQELHETKAAMLYTQWLRDIRQMAYVKINDD